MCLRTDISTAKKHKADLIHKAKVKKAYYKMLKHEGGPEESEGVDLEPSKQDLGRFAPENDEEDGLETLQPREEREPAKEPTSKPKKLPYFYKPPKKKDATAKPVPKRTKEEAIEEREARREKWNRKSPSRLGRQRGQPDLGARVEVMLERIQRQAN